jgi:hypothetical protein
MAFLVPLDALAPVERAVFMRREVSGYGYPDVALGIRAPRLGETASDAVRGICTYVSNLGGRC